jgi:hypothetical protein
MPKHMILMTAVITLVTIKLLYTVSPTTATSLFGVNL